MLEQTAHAFTLKQVKTIAGCFLIKPDDLHWRQSSLMKILNADYLERADVTIALAGVRPNA